MDMSDRRQTEQLFRRLLETAPDARVITDRSGKIILVNSQTEKLFDYTKEELLGQAVEMLVPARLPTLMLRKTPRYKFRCRQRRSAEAPSSARYQQALSQA